MQGRAPRGDVSGRAKLALQTRSPRATRATGPPRRRAQERSWRGRGRDAGHLTEAPGAHLWRVHNAAGGFLACSPEEGSPAGAARVGASGTGSCGCSGPRAARAVKPGGHARQQRPCGRLVSLTAAVPGPGARSHVLLRSAARLARCLCRARAQAFSQDRGALPGLCASRRLISPPWPARRPVPGPALPAGHRAGRAARAAAAAAGRRRRHHGRPGRRRPPRRKKPGRGIADDARGQLRRVRALCGCARQAAGARLGAAAAERGGGLPAAVDRPGRAWGAPRRPVAVAARAARRLCGPGCGAAVCSGTGAGRA